jgi:hypothetical protein
LKRLCVPAKMQISRTSNVFLHYPTLIMTNQVF